MNKQMKTIAALLCALSMASGSMAAAPSAGTTPQPDYLLTGCQQTESTGNPRSADRAVDPASLLSLFLQNRDHRAIDLATRASIKPILLEGTTHGNIVMFSNIANYGGTAFRYDPIPNYEGKDRAVFLAEFEGKVYKIVINIVVSPTVGESPLLPGEKPVCPPPKLIKVTQPSSGASGFGSGYGLNSVTVTFADLHGAAVGQAQLPGMALREKPLRENCWSLSMRSRMAS